LPKGSIFFLNTTFITAINMSNPTTAIPAGSLVLQTGINGFIASHIALEFLQRGYRVRGTVRDAASPGNAWLSTGTNPLADFAAKGALEIVEVPDIAAPGAWDATIRGVSVVVHTATVLNFDPDPNNVITPVLASVRNLLAAAKTEPSVRVFVYTSSAPADSATGPRPLPDGSPAFVPPDDKSVVCDAGVKMAWAEGERGPGHGGIVYMASKVEGEKAIWKFVDEEKPAFVANIVSPYSTIGKILGGEARSTPSWIQAMYAGQMFPISIMSAREYFLASLTTLTWLC
jgi:nucleoside-diphosphate-sugar epimerase